MGRRVDFGEALVRSANRICDEAQERREESVSAPVDDRNQHHLSIAQGLERASEILQQEYDRALRDAERISEA